MERSSNPDKSRFIEYAKSSAAELLTQMDIGIEIGYVSEDTGNVWIKECCELSLMLKSMINKFKNN